MKQETKDKIKLSVREILLSCIDLTHEVFEPIYKRCPSLFNDYIKYKKWREFDKRSYNTKIWQIEKRGYIEKFRQNRNENIKLTSKGQRIALKYIFQELQIKPQKHWDKKWRMVIFDIPEKKKYLREVVRLKLKKFGFYLLQKSVWVYPFDCEEIIWTLKYIYSLGKYTQFILAEKIETEIDLIDHFYNQKILNKNVKIK